MEPERIVSFKPSPSEGAFKCVQCGHVLQVKQGTLVPPCPRCGFREFERTDDTVCA